MNIAIKSTRDVDLAVPIGVRDALSPYVTATIDERQMYFKSADPPSWIALVGDLSAWQMLLGGAALLYVKEVIKEAAKEHWRDRSKLLAGLKATAATPLLELGEAIVAMRNACTPRTTVALVLAWPDDFHGTRLVLTGRSLEAVAAELAWFLGTADQIQQALDDLRAGGVVPMAPIAVEIGDDGTITLRFIDQRREREQRYVVR